MIDYSAYIYHMANERVKTLFLMVITIAGIIALSIQFYLALGNTSISAAESITRFFSFFTIQSNILVTVCSAYLLMTPHPKPGQFLSSPKVHSAITVYIIIVSLVYNIVLRKLYYLVGWGKFTNELLHVFIPAVFVIYWFIFVPKKQLSWNVFPWLIYPLGYGIYVLIRGAFVRYYPYPFLNVLKIGYPNVIISFGVLLMLFLLTSLILVAFGKLLLRRGMQ
jgi:hypothetical protein